MLEHSEKEKQDTALLYATPYLHLILLCFGSSTCFILVLKLASKVRYTKSGEVISMTFVDSRCVLSRAVASSASRALHACISF